MFLDACAIISMMAEEETASAYFESFLTAKEASTSAFAAFEAVLVLSRPDQFNCTFLAAEAFVADWLELQNIKLKEPHSQREVLAHAISVAHEKGLSRRSLSSFDCFHYAYAKALKMPLLTLNQKLRETDLVCLP
jgi:ribonuclease VapC